MPYLKAVGVASKSVFPILCFPLLEDITPIELGSKVYNDLVGGTTSADLVGASIYADNLSYLGLILLMFSTCLLLSKFLYGSLYIFYGFCTLLADATSSGPINFFCDFFLPALVGDYNISVKLFTLSYTSSTPLNV